MKKNPFGDDQPVRPPAKENPFGDTISTQPPHEAAKRIEQAARRVRSLRSQLGSEGLTISATRELIDEVAGALEAASQAFRGLAEE